MDKGIARQGTGVRIAPPGKLRVIACDTFEGPFADELVGDYCTLNEAISAAKAELSPMVAVYVYDEKGQCCFSEYMRSQL